MDIKKQLNIAGEGAMLVAKQAKRMKIANVSLPSAYKKLGEEVYKAGILRNDFNEIYSKIDSSIKQQEDLNQARPAAEGFAEKMKAAAKLARNLAVSKKIEYDRNGLFSELGRLAYEKNRSVLGNGFSTNVVFEEINELASLDQEIETIQTSSRNSYFNPRNVAISLTAFTGIALMVFGYRFLFGSKENLNTVAISSNEGRLNQTIANEKLPILRDVDPAETRLKTQKSSEGRGSRDSTKNVSHQKGIDNTADFGNTSGSTTVTKSDTSAKSSSSALVTNAKIAAALEKDSFIKYKNDNKNSFIVEIKMDGKKGSSLDVLNNIPTLKSLEFKNKIETFELLNPHFGIEALIIPCESNLVEIPQKFPNLKMLFIAGDSREDSVSCDLSNVVNNLLKLEVLVLGCHLKNENQVKNIKCPSGLNTLIISIELDKDLSNFSDLFAKKKFKYVRVLLNSNTSSDNPIFYSRINAEIFDLLVNENSKHFFHETDQGDVRIEQILSNDKIGVALIPWEPSELTDLSGKTLIAIKKNPKKIVSRNGTSKNLVFDLEKYIKSLYTQ